MGTSVCRLWPASVMIQKMTSRENGEAATPFCILSERKAKYLKLLLIRLAQLGSGSKYGLFAELHLLTGFPFYASGVTLMFAHSSIVWPSVSPSLLCSRTFRLRLTDINLLRYFVIIDTCLLTLVKTTEFISFLSLPRVSHLIFPKWFFPLFILWIQRQEGGA